MKNTDLKRIYVRRGATSSALYLTADSGKIIYRDKIDTLIGIKHPGIVLGADKWGTVWVIHNHYKIGCAQIVTMDDFSEGVSVFYDTRPVTYSPVEIVNRAIWHWQRRKQYSWLFHNCQHFVNEVAKGKHYSETIEKVSDNTMFLGGCISLLGLITRNKTLVQTGVGIAGAGATGKILNRI